jgi:acyl-CoA synthetase (NDP forming)
VEFNFDQIDAIINADSLAIVGASRNPAKFGASFTASQLTFGFEGPVYLVNPSEKEIMGREVYPDLQSLPETPDLVCLMIPAESSMDVLRECAKLRVKGVVIMAAGFSEIGDEGRVLEEEALRLAREGGFRIVGPNCFGLYNPRNGLTLLPGYDFSKEPGKTAFISQSGGLAAHMGRQGKSLGIRFSSIVSYGNGADLNESDLLRYFSCDPHTEIIAGYLEGARDGREFFSALREASSRKQVVLWKVGKGESSRRAVMSHTGSLAGSSQIWEGLFRQCGIIEAGGIDEVCDVVLALSHLGRNPGRRLLLCGGGGGLGTYGADLAEEQGLVVPPLADESLARLQKILNRAGAVASNPLDIGAPLIPPPAFDEVMLEAGRNPSTDIVIFDLAINFAYRMHGDEGLDRAADVLIRASRETRRPTVVVLYSRALGSDDLVLEETLRRLRDKLIENGIPVYPSTRRALRAISLVNN